VKIIKRTAVQATITRWA